jgi:hypothetical protein
MASSPLPSGASAEDAADVVFAGCSNRGSWAAFLYAENLAQAIVGGVAGVAVGFGVTWLVARHLGAKKVIG